MRGARHLFLQNVPVYRCSEMGAEKGAEGGTAESGRKLTRFWEILPEFLAASEEKTEREVHFGTLIGRKI